MRPRLVERIRREGNILPKMGSILRVDSTHSREGNILRLGSIRRKVGNIRKMVPLTGSLTVRRLQVIRNSRSVLS